MRKFLLCLLALAVILSLFAGCTPEKTKTAESTTPGTVSTPEPELIDQNTLVSKDSKITLGVMESKLYVTYLGTLKSDENVIAENSEFVLPKYIKGSEKTELDWNYVSFDMFRDKIVNGVKTEGIVYNFEEKENKLNCKVYCFMRPDISGPFEFYTEFENKGEKDIRINPEEFASFVIDVQDSSNTRIVSFAKEERSGDGIHFEPNDEPEDGVYKPLVYSDGSGITSKTVSE